MKLKTLALAALAFAPLAALALPVTPPTNVLLDFSGNICGVSGGEVCLNAAPIGQNYGDMAGLLDVSHRAFRVSDGQTSEAWLKFWASDYSDLEGVAWGGSNYYNYRSEIVFTPASGQNITLDSFDFGDYRNIDYVSSVQIYAADGSTLLWDGGSFNPGLTATHFAPAITSNGALVLRWGPDGYDVGIDNIALSVSAVPEPAPWALALLGVGMFAWRWRRAD